MPFAGDDVAEHPIIKFFPDSECKGEYKRYDRFEFPVEENGKETKKEVRGKHWYFRCKTDEEVSRLELIDNYKYAALKKDGQILHEDYNSLVFTVADPEGPVIWTLLVATGGGGYRLNIIEEKAFQKRLKFGAKQMQLELASKGRVTVYGVNFDFDRAILQPGSDKVLLEIVKLLQQDPGLKLEIQGHTDNVGSDDYNLELSQKRAATVMDFLINHGIAADRLVAKGYGASKPVAR